MTTNLRLWGMLACGVSMGGWITWIVDSGDGFTTPCVVSFVGLFAAILILGYATFRRSTNTTKDTQ